MTFLTTAITLRFPTTNNQLRTSSNPRNQATIQDERQDTQTTITHNDAFQTDDLDAFDSDCDEAPGAKAVLMANLSSYDSDVISEMYYSEQPAFDPASDIEITSDNNIISYDQYLKETESATVQNTTSIEQQNAVIMSVFDEITHRIAKCNVESNKNKNKQESLTTELEKYKERVRMFEERQKVDLNAREKYIDSQMNDMILNKNAKFATFWKEIDTLKFSLSKHVKENESLMTTINVLKNQTKEKEDKYIEKEIDFKKQIKELENIVFKVVKIEVPSELPKVSLVNKSFQKLKNHLAKFDKVVKERTTASAITEGTWGFEHTKEVFITQVIPFLNSLRESFKDFDNGLHNELNEVKMVLTKWKLLLNSVLSCSNLDAPALNEFFVINDLKAQLQAKEFSISKLRAHIATLKGKNVFDNKEPVNNASVLAPGMFRLDLEPLSHRLKNNREAHKDYHKKTKEHTDTLRGIVE
ncbi:hypothetical protein Tco_0965082 [Tanacetum coccineum]